MSVTRSIDAVFVESFAGGSHEAFAEGWLARSRHRWRRLGHRASSAKEWRLRAGALALAPRLGALDPPPRAVVATSLVDLAHLRALSGLDRRRRPPAFLLYMHENQLTYPPSPVRRAYHDRSPSPGPTWLPGWPPTPWPGTPVPTGTPRWRPPAITSSRSRPPGPAACSDACGPRVSCRRGWTSAPFPLPRHGRWAARR
ncbi:MAG: DUF3524 domain-containing protein [Acidobacteriota bacterium]|nr:DUF3524 domain-containing protein [Acidobacteriota bacterium]